MHSQYKGIVNLQEHVPKNVIRLNPTYSAIISEIDYLKRKEIQRFNDEIVERFIFLIFSILSILACIMDTWIKKK